MNDYVGRKIGDYRIKQLLGRGGQAAVYLAENIHTKWPRALKILFEQFSGDESRERRFVDEARILNDLDHPNIVHVYDVRKAGELYCIVMEYIDGGDGQPADLQSYLRRLGRNGRFEPDQVRTWAMQLGEALHYAHGRDVLHRDIKPGNILLDAQNNIHLADFGLAKAMGQDVEAVRQKLRESADEFSLLKTWDRDGPPVPADGAELSQLLRGQGLGSSAGRSSSGSGLLGTIDYMAPEQRGEGGTVDERTDIYGVGIMLYRLLTGRMPLAMADKPSQIIPSLSKRWDEITGKCMRYDQDGRYQTARELVEDLQRPDTLVAVPGDPDQSEQVPWADDTVLEELREITRKDVDRCRKAIERGRRNDIRHVIENAGEERVAEWAKAAQLGVAEGVWLIGRCYYEGLHTSHSYVMAFKYFMNARQRGLLLAAYMLGVMIEADPSPSSPPRAFRFYYEAARGKEGEPGFAPAQYNVGICYMDGFGTEADVDEARKWLTKASEQGLDNATQQLKRLKVKLPRKSRAGRKAALVAMVLLELAIVAGGLVFASDRYQYRFARLRGEMESRLGKLEQKARPGTFVSAGGLLTDFPLAERVRDIGNQAERSAGRGQVWASAFEYRQACFLVEQCLDELHHMGDLLQPLAEAYQLYQGGRFAEAAKRLELMGGRVRRPALERLRSEVLVPLAETCEAVGRADLLNEPNAVAPLVARVDRVLATLEELGLHDHGSDGPTDRLRKALDAIAAAAGRLHGAEAPGTGGIDYGQTLRTLRADCPLLESWSGCEPVKALLGYLNAMDQAERLLDEGQIEQAGQLAGEALALRPGDDRARALGAVASKLRRAIEACRQGRDETARGLLAEVASVERDLVVCARIEAHLDALDEAETMLLEQWRIPGPVAERLASHAERAWYCRSRADRLARLAALPEKLTVVLTGGPQRVEIELRRITRLGGSDGDGAGDEAPLVSLRRRLTGPYYLGQTEVTQQQYRALMGNNPSFSGVRANPDRLPVESVTWSDCMAFCQALSGRLAAGDDCSVDPAGRLVLADGWQVDLPTVWEWEWAYRAGATGAYPVRTGRMPWPSLHAQDRRVPKEVDQLFHQGLSHAEVFSLTGMADNVREWCAGEGDRRYTKGAAFDLGPRYAECDNRMEISHEGGKFSNVGFRVCLRLALTGPEQKE